jgi:uncharacterized membrane protein YbhN (UPF0104 family)
MRSISFLKELAGAQLFKVALMALIVAVILLSGVATPFVKHFDTRQLFAALLVQPLLLIGLLLQGIRHAVLIDRQNLSFWTATKAVSLSQGMNLLLPARLSELLKATYLRDRANIPMSAGVSAVLLERTVDLIIVGFLGGICLFIFGTLVSKTLVVVFSSVALIIVGVALFGGSYILAFARFLPWEIAGGLVERIYSHFIASLKNRVFFHGVWLGLLIWIISFLNVFLLLSVAGGTQMSLYGALLVFVCTTVGSAVPALPGGLGTYEAGAAYALTSLGYPFAEALALAVVLHGAQLVLPLVLALVVISTERLGLLSLVREFRRKGRP